MIVTEKNKQTAVAFYQMMFNDCLPEAAIKLYSGDTYIQHNPHVPDGKKGFITYFNEMAIKFPGKQVTIKRIIAEDNLVVLHCFQQWPGDSDYAGIDIFRFDEAGKIVEHWDVLQVVPDQSNNSNGLF